MPLSSYLSVCDWGSARFCIVFHVPNATYVCVSSKSFIIFIVALSLYMKMADFVFWCCGLVFLLCLWT
jgi:hypothetical protein